MWLPSSHANLTLNKKILMNNSLSVYIVLVQKGQTSKVTFLVSVKISIKNMKKKKSMKTYSDLRMMVQLPVGHVTCGLSQIIHRGE